MAYTYKVGAKSEAAVSGVLEFVQHRQAKAEEQAKEQRAFDQKLREIVFNNPNDYNADYVNALIAGKSTTGIPARSNIPAIDVNTLAPGQTYSTKVAGGTMTYTGGKNEAEQDRLEKSYTDRLVRITSNRSGGLGLQDAKVNQAIHLRSLVDQYYDPRTGSYNIPSSQYKELAIGLASLVSNSNVALESTIRGIEQRTAKGDINGALTYVLGVPRNASTQAVMKNLIDSIDRQGQVSERLRNKYLQDFKRLSPERLDKERLDRLSAAELGSSFQDTLNQSLSRQNQRAAPSFNSEQEAVASGLPSGTIVIINGRRAVIE